MGKIILNIGKVIALVSAITVVAGFFIVRDNPRSFELGAALSFYGFIVFMASLVIIFIAKIIVSQRG